MTLRSLLDYHNDAHRSVVEFSDKNGYLLEEWYRREATLLGKQRRVFPPLIDYGREHQMRASAVDVVEKYLLEEVYNGVAP